MPPGEVLDAAVVAELRRAQDAFGNPVLIRQLVALFVANTPAKMERVRGALAGRDAAAVEEVAHTLRTNCAMLGATRMAEACGRMEMAAAGADLATASAVMEEVECLLPGVLAALSEL